MDDVHLLEQTTESVVTWLNRYVARLPNDEITISSEQIQFNQWATYSMNSLLDLSQEQQASVVLQEMSLLVLRRIASSVLDRQRFVDYCLSKITVEFKEEFGKSQWKNGAIRRVQRQQSKMDVVETTGVYAFEASSSDCLWKLTDASGQTSTTRGMYGGQTLVAFFHRWKEHRKKWTMCRNGNVANPAKFHEDVAKAFDDDIHVCVFADLSSLQDDSFAHPTIATFLEAVLIILLGSLQVNGLDSRRETINFVQRARAIDMPQVVWAGWNRAFPLSQGIKYDTWNATEIKLLRQTFNKTMGTTEVNLRCRDALAKEGYTRTLQGIQAKRYRLGLWKDEEALTEGKHQAQQLIDEIANEITSSHAIHPTHYQAEVMSKHLMDHHSLKMTERSYELLLQRLQPDKSGDTATADLDAVEIAQAIAIRNDFCDKSDHEGMARHLRDQLKSTTARSLRACLQYFNLTWADDKIRSGSWERWELDFLDELYEANPKLGKMALSKIAVVAFQDKFGRAKTRGKLAYQNKAFRRYYERGAHYEKEGSYAKEKRPQSNVTKLRDDNFELTDVSEIDEFETALHS